MPYAGELGPRGRRRRGSDDRSDRVPRVWHRPRQGARFCDGCGAPVTVHDSHAEFKQVTVLFADVVHSMDIAAAVGAERWREIMAELADRCAAVVQRYGSTVASGLATESWRCRRAGGVGGPRRSGLSAALGVQEQATRLAVDVRERDGLDLRCGSG